jgi:hypothetical protein
MHSQYTAALKSQLDTLEIQSAADEDLDLLRQTMQELDALKQAILQAQDQVVKAAQGYECRPYGRYF